MNEESRIRKWELRIREKPGAPVRQRAAVAPAKFSHYSSIAMPSLRQLSGPELRSMMNGGEPFVLIDVRTEEERALAKIEGSILLNQEGHDHIMSLDRDATIVFQCHHGIRSQAAAEYFLEAGFENLFNLRGGIDAWSQQVDPSVPRY